MAKMCPKCGTSVIEDKSLFCKKCGTQLPPFISELKITDRSFRYSNLFALVIYSDLLLCFIFCIGAIGSYLNVSSANYLNPTVLYFFLIYPANLILDLLLLKNKKTTSDSIDIRICWIKGLIGVAGILTIISGLYFIIISVNMDNAYKARMVRNRQDVRIENNKEATSGNPFLCSICGAAIGKYSAYCPECKTILLYDKAVVEKKNEEAEKAAKFQHDIAQENIVKLQDSGNFHLIFNFVTRYPNSNLIDQNFFNLKTVLAKKGIILTDLELSAVISEVKQEGELGWVKTRILNNNPTSSDGCIKNYIEVFGKVSKNLQKERLINYLIKILKDNFNYQGNLASDLIRIEKEVELERFENSLTGQAAGKWITINDIDRIDGYEFERVLKELFKKMGYHVIHTSLSNDQGADLIVEKFGVKTVIQAKNWQDNVTNKGVQEVYAAIKHYDAQKAMVISSSGFTQSARELARSTDVTLWDRSILAAMLDENPIFRV
jgi:HJR/Mrr/RecB family endonuclease